MTSKPQPAPAAPEEPEEYYVYPILPGTDYRIHTPEHPFCDDSSCPCKSDQEAIDTLNGYYQDGLVSAEDADKMYKGKTLR
jgi:hypothetical protein